MEKEFVSGKIGADGEYSLVFKDGKLRIEAGYEAGVKAGLFVEVGSDFVIDAIEKAIPGKLDDALLEMLKAALKA